jgi:hypothetical protein
MAKSHEGDLLLPNPPQILNVDHPGLKRPGELTRGPHDPLFAASLTILRTIAAPRSFATIYAGPFRKLVVREGSTALRADVRNFQNGSGCFGPGSCILSKTKLCAIFVNDGSIESRERRSTEAFELPHAIRRRGCKKALLFDRTPSSMQQSTVWRAYDV